MNNNTVSVRFDDADLSIDQVVGALNKAGYAVPDYATVE
jgi:copper chaperone CopZ